MTPSEAAHRPFRRQKLADAAAWLLAAFVALALASAVRTLPSPGGGLRDAVLGRLAQSGVDNPVTAVLMSFRAYDTLLELGVLFLALVGIWSTARMPRRRPAPPSVVLAILNQLLVPFLLLFAGYLLWAGSHEPGGAFQAGAVLAAAGVLAVLSGAPAPGRVSETAVRASILLGLTTFVAVGAGTIAVGGNLLEYPRGFSKGLILLIEGTATVSIGATLLAAFAGGRPGGGGDAAR